MKVMNLLAVAVLAAPLGAEAAAVRVTPVGGSVRSGSPIVVNPGRVGIGVPAHGPSAAPTLLPALKLAPQAPAVGIVAAQQAFAALAEAPAVQKLADQSEAGLAQHPAALAEVYDRSFSAASEAPVVAGMAGSAASGLSKAAERTAPRLSSIEKAAVSVDDAAGAGVVIDGIKRLWNITVGKFLRWVSGREKKNAKALAEKLIAELDAQLPKMNQAAAEIGKTVHLLKMQIDKETKESARLDALINKAIELGKETEAGALLKQKAPIDASLAAAQARYESAQKNQAAALKAVQDFYYERQEALNKIRGLLARDEMAQMQARMNELKGQFKIGDIKGQMDKLEQVVNENEAEVKGQQDVIDNSGDSAMKEIEDALKNDSVADEIARRKAELEKKKSQK